MPDEYSEAIQDFTEYVGQDARIHLLTSRNTLEQEENMKSEIYKMIKKRKINCIVLENQETEKLANRKSVLNVKYGVHEKLQEILKSDIGLKNLEKYAYYLALLSNPAMASDIYKLLIPYFAN